MSDEKRASFIFTSHYVSINSLSFGATVTLVTVFTSHYVSINSIKDMNENLGNKNLHPTMYLLIPVLFYEYIH